MTLLKEFKEVVDEVAFIEAQLLEQLVLEGVDDPGILKCIFMAGGPGSGKSFVAQEIFGIDKNLKSSVASSGLKVVNSDPAFEAQLKKQNRQIIVGTYPYSPDILSNFVLPVLLLKFYLFLNF